MYILDLLVLYGLLSILPCSVYHYWENTTFPESFGEFLELTCLPLLLWKVCKNREAS